MIPKLPLLLLFAILISVTSCDDDEPERSPLSITGITAGSIPLQSNTAVVEDVPVNASLSIVFSAAVDRNAALENISLWDNASNSLEVELSFSQDDKRIAVRPVNPLRPNSVYALNISESMRGAGGETFEGANYLFQTAVIQMTITAIVNDGVDLLPLTRPSGISLTSLSFEITFSAPLDPASVDADDFRITGLSNVPVSISFLNENQTVRVDATERLGDLGRYEIVISDDIEGINRESFTNFSKVFYTAIDPTPDFPEISDEALLTKIQEQTFRYFWDFGHPVSGLARERNTSGEVVTSGGSGFGIMAIIVGIERGFITRSEGVSRMNTIVNFLESADRFHGAWSHWLNGSTGTVVPFSANDNGGDLVETSFLIQGLLTFRQYLDSSIPDEQALIDRINGLWQSVEWSWYTQDQDVLYWHWSPDKGWIMNHQIKGYNESLITYILAASSPTHGIEPSVYHKGWASNGGMANGRMYYNYPLPLGSELGGPLFFTHYSFLGLDPRNLSDTYADYWDQNVNHTLINRAYAIENPKNFVGYSEDVWGLTASDNQNGYSAHSPTNDLGVITPTAAISSLPYTPEESMQALRFFYYSLGDRLWGDYGFYDAFNLTDGWTANSYLAIDQGPIIIMIENYRSSLLWDLFMSAPEVQEGLTKLGFEY